MPLQLQGASKLIAGRPVLSRESGRSRMLWFAQVGPSLARPCWETLPAILGRTFPLNGPVLSNFNHYIPLLLALAWTDLCIVFSSNVISGFPFPEWWWWWWVSHNKEHGGSIPHPHAARCGHVTPPALMGGGWKWCLHLQVMSWMLKPQHDVPETRSCPFPPLGKQVVEQHVRKPLGSRMSSRSSGGPPAQDWAQPDWATRNLFLEVLRLGVCWLRAYQQVPSEHAVEFLTLAWQRTANWLALTRKFIIS